MIIVTQQQRDNQFDALHVMWPSVPPENVVRELMCWRRGAGELRKLAPTCGSVACFGGWCVWWPNFRAQGVIEDDWGAPTNVEGFSSDQIAEMLFGDDDMFNVRDCHEADSDFVGSDHELITHRLAWLILNSVVQS